MLHKLGGPLDAPPQHTVLLLHATGMCTAAYAPLAAALVSHGYAVRGLDLPQHGAAAGAALPVPVNVSGLTAYLLGAVMGAHLRGCLVLGHSAGGALALCAAAADSGVFTAVFAFEPPACIPDTYAVMRSLQAAGRLRTAGQVLAAGARRRRPQFSDAAAAARRLSGRPPFSEMRSDALAGFLRAGLVPVMTHAPGTAPGGEGGAVQLACQPMAEAALYEAFDPAASVVPGDVRCAVALAISGDGAASCEHSTMQPSVTAWLNTQQRDSSGAVTPQGVHDELRVLGRELAAAIPGAELLCVSGVGHFGPLQVPERIAELAHEFFGRQCPVPTRTAARL
jgi:pimeloyl-ACP methyl ester carboxylesterase